jgi:3-hydroxy-9,10-secoandrosta-1,3,5(10)-triene-9,17-dione monooxygenase reductase component
MSATDTSQQLDHRTAIGTPPRARQDTTALRLIAGSAFQRHPRAGSVSSHELRAAIGHFATGVTVVSSLAPDGRPLGSTANAVSSVSLDPPLVLVCLRNESETLAALIGHGHFAVNVLGEDQIEHARRFARPSTPETWARIEHRRSHHDLPLLDGALATLQCKLYDLADGGDHKIVIGRVLEVDHPKSHIDPLVFYRGAFARLSEADRPPRGSEQGEAPPAPASAAATEEAQDVFIPTPEGELRLLPVEHGQGSPQTSVIAVIGQPQGSRGALVYLHAGCLFGDSLGHLDCRRRAALRAAMARIRAHGSGVLLYHRDDSSPFAGCCAQAAGSVATSGPAMEVTRALRGALDRLRLRGVRLLRVDGAGNELDPSVLGLDVAALESLDGVGAA